MYAIRSYYGFGRKPVYLMIFIAAAGMVLESLFLGVEWRIIMASFIAIVLSETADTEVRITSYNVCYTKLLRGDKKSEIARRDDVIEGQGAESGDRLVLEPKLLYV